MLCSLGELGLTIHDFPYAVEDGIFVLSSGGLPTGGRTSSPPSDSMTPVWNLKSPPTGLTACPLSAWREAAVTFDSPSPLHQPAVKNTTGDIRDLLQVEVQTPSCASAMWPGW